ncbi:MAG: hypothetical protein HYS18_05585 [Burkholderiales bacterium]|nr:hypothetical protein [Burkholderiales bacterium]
MKSSSNLLFAIGMASAAAWAQTGVPATQVIPAQSVQSPGSEQNAASTDQSSGASTSGASGQGRSEGQLVTSEMAHSKVSNVQSPITAQPHTENGVTYMCGGVGEAEAQYMSQAARDYDLKLTFAARSGAYVADPTVTIADAKGNEILRKICGGPMMLVDLPKGGAYRVKAEIAGHTLDRTVRVREGRINTAVFTWPSNVVGVDRQAETRRGPSTESSGGSEAAGGSTGRGASDSAPARRQSDLNERQEAD